MSFNNLLEVDPEKLFQTFSVAEVDQVQKKLHHEIERKKEELRAMVGERYRDLIHAADTIEDMKSTTSSILNHINDMIVICKNLHETHLVGFKIQEQPSQISFQANADPVTSISVQIKLLMEIPEKIWKCINKNDFVKAAQLFIMARHINTGLQLQLGNRNEKPMMQSLQRLVQQQWNSISNLSQTIIDMCGQRLQDVDITVEVACSCLVGLYLLDSQVMVDLLNILTNLHSRNSLTTALQFDLHKILDGDVKAQIKNKIVSGVRIVIKTIELIYACFVENKGGVVLEKLEELYGKNSEPLLKLVEFSDTNALKHLPSVISNYKLSMNKSIEALNSEEIKTCVENWSLSIQHCINDNVSAILQSVSRIRVLHEIREEAFKIEAPQNWNTICESLNIPQVHIWVSYFQPLLTARVKFIVDSRWQKIYDTFKTQLLVDLTKVSAESEIEKEANINWFIWKDLIGDTIIESRNEVVTVMNSLMKGMSRQDHGFTPNMEKLCKSLEDELQKLLDDLKEYLYLERKRDRLVPLLEEEERWEQVYTDTMEIEEYLCDVPDKYIESMLTYIKACFEEPTLQSTELQRKTTAIYTARFVQAITILIPNVRRCYIPDNNDTAMLDEASTKRWGKVCDVMKENCQYCWGKWLDIAVIKVKDLTNGLPQGFSLEENIDYLMMQWDIIKIVEKDDEGNSIESTIKVPAGPSLKVQEYLYTVSRLLDEVIPHTLPLEIHTKFVDQITSVTFAHYNTVIREKEAEINQRCALQLLMDVRHLTLLLVPRENKKYVEMSQDICEFLREKIDPFDYDVFYPYIQTNLKRSVQRVQTLLGSLVLHHGQLLGIISTKPVTSGGTGDKAANILASADTHWFSVLPVATPVTPHKKQDKPMKKKQAPSSSPNKSRSELTDLMSNSIPINFANARSGAASFFNSMTSDWFSG
ncbi:unnamed protein product [Leptosia nina]|uniref:Conserved oligomeric Golgi complex subunit 1 n=1 Tax=Leptosia nina TaxID=320188 RepID=A0AAV1IZ81_9NEOP